LQGPHRKSNPEPPSCGAVPQPLAPLIQYGLKIAVCAAVHTEHINTLCEHNAEFINF